MEPDNQVKCLVENPAGAEVSPTSVTPAALNLRPMEKSLLYSGSVSNNNLGTLQQCLGSIHFHFETV